MSWGGQTRRCIAFAVWPSGLEEVLDYAMVTGGALANAVGYSNRLF